MLNRRLELCLMALFLCATNLGTGRGGEKKLLALKLEGVSDFVSRKSGLKADIVKMDERLVLKIVEGIGKNGRLDSALAKKGVKAEEVEQTIISAWVGLRTGAGAKGIPKDKPLTVELIATALDSMVPLTIRSNPPEAKVYFWDKNQYAGKTEVRRWVMPGRVRIMLEKDMYAPVDKEIEVPEKNHTHTEDLKKVER